jgi:hypothetical protein
MHPLRAILTGIAVFIACAGACTAPPNGTVFCARETGTVRLFTVGGDSASPWSRPATRVSIGLSDASRSSVFSALARHHTVIRTATIVDNTGSGMRIELGNVRIRGASTAYGPARPLISMDVGSFAISVHHTDPRP